MSRDPRYDCCIQTYSHKVFDFRAPTPDMIDIQTIATGLAREQRFGRQTEGEYSVADHSVRASCYCTQEFALEVLMHDSAEAYIGDIPSPLKNMLKPLIKPIERRILKAVWRKYDLDGGSDVWMEIEKWDELTLGAEARDLFVGGPIVGMYPTPTEESPKLTIERDSSRHSKDLFLTRFYQLAELRGLTVLD